MIQAANIPLSGALLVLCLVVVSVGCDRNDKAAAPACRAVDPDANVRGNAGCLLVHEGRLLVVRDRKSGALGFPAGKPLGDEAAACTAHRETWEETGLDVRVEALLRTYDYEAPFYLYRCRGLLPQNGPVTWQVQGVAEAEIVHLRAPNELTTADWRFPPQLTDVVHLAERLIAEAARGEP